MINALITYERITTTKAKALAVRQVAEKMITRAKVDSVHNRRVIARRITDEGVLAKLFTDVGPRFEKRPGGYTRIYKIGPRQGDAAEMVILELVDRKVDESPESNKKTKEKKAATKAE
jgi:large subunit ribosomal protein L17